MAVVSVKIGIAPPTILGVTTLNMVLGSTHTISKAILMNSVPAYYHVESLPMGGIEIIGGMQSALTQTNTAETVVYITNGTPRVYRNVSNGNVINGVVTNATMNGGSLKVIAHKLGSTYIKYKAKAVDGSLESEYGLSMQGTLNLNVVPANNQPPSAISGSTVQCPYLGSVAIDASKFVNGYIDPEGDPPYQVRFDTIPPQGKSYLNGELLTSGFITTYANIQNNPVIFVSDATTTNNSTVNIHFSISDVGSGQFKT